MCRGPGDAPELEASGTKRRDAAMTDEAERAGAAGEPSERGAPSDYEALIDGMNRQIAELTPESRDVEAPRHPVVFVVGIPRSGSTLLAQLVAESGLLGYCSNLVARFWRNPAFGARVQRVLAPMLPDDSMTYRSHRGRTERWYEPHEFGYFWERFFPFDDHHELAEGEESEVDWDQLRREIAGLEAELQRPMLFKNLLLSMVVGALADALPGAKFVEIRRDPLAVANSLYRSRLAEFDDPEEWFSARPAHHESLRDEEPAAQIAEQMVAIERKLRRTETRLASDRWCRLDYEAICQRPAESVATVCQMAGLDAFGGLDRLPDEFEATGVRDLEAGVNDRLRGALAERELLERPLKIGEAGDS